MLKSIKKNLRTPPDVHKNPSKKRIRPSKNQSKKNDIAPPPRPWGRAHSIQDFPFQARDVYAGDRDSFPHNGNFPYRGELTICSHVFGQIIPKIERYETETGDSQKPIPISEAWAERKFKKLLSLRGHSDKGFSNLKRFGKNGDIQFFHLGGFSLARRM
ncbi:MAG: hypothetical protein CM15mP70_16660 [Pelagibacteraceae bacterium]|nr:MAG: hypothetical protein CM15mP70_16660 [Pelagibacteraceae bacterium]